MFNLMKLREGKELDLYLHGQIRISLSENLNYEIFH